MTFDFWSWMVEWSMVIIVMIINLFPDTGPTIFPGGILDSPMGWAFSAVASVVDFPVLFDVLEYMIAVRLLILTVATIRWIWGWVVG